MIALYFRRIPCISFENMFLVFLFFPTKSNLYFSRCIAVKGSSQEKKYCLNVIILIETHVLLFSFSVTCGLL